MSSRFGRSRRGDALPSGDALEGLLEDMHDLRMTLAADLTAAAGAADAGADEVARDIIEADRVELARFARVANVRLERLARGASEPVVHERPAWKRRVAVALPVVPVVGAMALSAAAATGVLPIPGATHPGKPAVVRADDGTNASFQQLVNVLNGDPNASQVIAAASKLHSQLRALIETSPNDPSRAAEIAHLLQMEQSLLLSKQPPGVSIVLNATRKLAARLVNVAPELRNSPSIAPTFIPTATPSHHPHKHVVSPSPSAKPSAPKPTTPTQPSPSQQPDPSPSPSSSPLAWPQ